MSSWALLLPLAAGYLLDRLFGDPPWPGHPVRLIGRGISAAEKALRRAFPASPSGEAAAGVLLAAGVPLLAATCYGVPAFFLWRWNAGLWLLAETALTYQLLAVHDLKKESMAVCRCLERNDLPAARQAVGRIVGRDVEALDREGVARAAVETVAENTSDGVVAPLLYTAVGGAALGLWYKAVNTLDSMVGYKNERYRWFGRASAKLDDFANGVPARCGAALMLLASATAGFDSRAALRIYRRDRRNHASPNSAHTEAVCAGALGVQLGGAAVYFGKAVEKPTIGDKTRPIEPEDIQRANRLMEGTSLLSLLLGMFLRVGIIKLLGGFL